MPTRTLAPPKTSLEPARPPEDGEGGSQDAGVKPAVNVPQKRTQGPEGWPRPCPNVPRACFRTGSGGGGLRRARAVRRQRPGLLLTKLVSLPTLSTLSGNGFGRGGSWQETNRLLSRPVNVRNHHDAEGYRPTLVPTGLESARKRDVDTLNSHRN